MVLQVFVMCLQPAAASKGEEIHMSSSYTSGIVASGERHSEGDPREFHWPVQNIIKKKFFFPTMQRATVRTLLDLDRKSCLEPVSSLLLTYGQWSK